MDTANEARRIVFITGGTSGIGSATALEFAAHGWDVAFHTRQGGENAKRLQAGLEGLGARHWCLQADLSQEAGTAEVLERLAPLAIDSLVNNAGGYVQAQPMERLGFADIAATFALNAIAPMLLALRLFESMKARGFGRIVNISSIAAKYGGSRTSLDYGCAKRALEGLTRTLAREGAASGVLVNTIRPGFIDTDFHTRFPKDRQARTALIPLGRAGTPQEVARAVYALGSGENTFITNETLAVAGGE